MSEAIILVGSNARQDGQTAPLRWAQETNARGSSLSTLEILGQSVLQRIVAELRKAKVNDLSVYVDESLCAGGVGGMTNVWEAAAERLMKLGNCVESVLILELGPYLEFDVAEFLSMHHESGKAVTRVFHEAGAMSLWVVNPARLPLDGDLQSLLQKGDSAEFYASGYINRLETPADLRRLVNDSLAGRCQFRPQGFEVKPGIWLAPGAQVEKTTRIVTPAFIGRGVKIGDECLITRCSNIESHSQVDYGSAIEDSSILSNTYVGIGLDLSHSIAQGSSLLNLRHDVFLHISDPAVMRENTQSSSGDRHFPVGLGIGEPAATSLGREQ